MQMIGVGEFYLTADVFQILRAQGTFDRALRAHIHEYRSLNRAMRADKLTPPFFSVQT